MKGVLILECLGGGDPGSEGLFILHMLNLMEVPVQYSTVRTKQQLVQGLRSHQYSIIHVATHGIEKAGKQKQFAGLWTQAGVLKQADLESLKGRLEGCTVVCTACRSAVKKFRQAFVKMTKCSHYIAPGRSTSFTSAIYFAHVFYHKHLVLKRSVEKSYEEYANRYKNPYKFTIESLRSFGS
jgi:hypothetical protein